MVTNRLMGIEILRNCPHPCAVTDVLIEVMINVRVDMLSGVLLGHGVDMLSDMGIIVMMPNPAIALEFTVLVSYTVEGILADLLTDSLVVPIIVVVAVMLRGEDTGEGGGGGAVTVSELYQV